MARTRKFRSESPGDRVEIAEALVGRRVVLAVIDREEPLVGLLLTIATGATSAGHAILEEDHPTPGRRWRFSRAISLAAIDTLEAEDG